MYSLKVTEQKRLIISNFEKFDYYFISIVSSKFQSFL